MAAVRALIAAVAAVALVAASSAAGADPARQARQSRIADFDTLCGFVADHYAYFDLRRTDWPAVCADLRPKAAAAPDRAAFIGVVERALAELYDPHAHTGTSTPHSARLVPTDGDLYAEWRGDSAVIVEVRRPSGADEAGLRAGLRVVEVDGRPIADAVDDRMPKHLTRPDPAARDWALRSVLAGSQDRRPVRVTVDGDGTRRTIAFVPDRRRTDLLSASLGDDGVAVVRPGNALGDPALVAAFDAALASTSGAAALVLDLRDTPSGGHAGVARGLLGRLVARPSAFQRHERVSEERATGVRHVWVEWVEPREPTFTRPVVVLVGRWTGSMGEGIAIGLSAARGAPVVGTPMAGLLGALDEVRLRGADLVVRIPTEKLSHVDGTPREAFVPCVLAADRIDEADPALRAARRFASRLATGAGDTVDARGCPPEAR